MATLPLASFAISDSKVEYVQIDSLVVMKIVKHVDIEFYAGMSDVAGETCQGILTGLISPEDKRLEITNCFPTPRPDNIIEGDDLNRVATTYADDKNIEILEMLKRFRNMNIDYELVGFYQAHLYGACFTHDMLESLIDYQSYIQDGVVLIYDPIKTRQGQLTIRAFRLSSKAFEVSLNTDWSPEADNIFSMKQAGLTFSSIMEELPIVMKNSHLMNVLLAELSLTKRKREAPHLELGTRRALEKSLRSLIIDVDELNRSLSSYNKYALEKQKFDTLYNSLTQKRQAENEARISRGEAPIPIDDIKKQLKMPQLQAKNGILELYLSSKDTEAYADYACSVTGENVAKLFVSEAISGTAGNLSEKERCTSISRL